MNDAVAYFLGHPVYIVYNRRLLRFQGVDENVLTLVVV